MEPVERRHAALFAFDETTFNLDMAYELEILKVITSKREGSGGHCSRVTISTLQPDFQRCLTPHRR